MFPKGGEVGMKTAQETSRVLTTKSTSPASLPDMEGWLRFATSATPSFAAFFPRSAIFLLGIRTYAYVKTLDKENFYVKRCNHTQVSNLRQTDGQERGKGGTG